MVGIKLAALRRRSDCPGLPRRTGRRVVGIAVFLLGAIMTIASGSTANAQSSQRSASPRQVQSSTGERQLATGYERLKIRDYSGAISAFVAGLAQSPNSALGHFYYAAALEGAGQSTAANQEYKRALALGLGAQAALAQQRVTALSQPAVFGPQDLSWFNPLEGNWYDEVDGWVLTFKRPKDFDEEVTLFSLKTAATINLSILLSKDATATSPSGVVTPLNYYAVCTARTAEHGFTNCDPYNQPQADTFIWKIWKQADGVTHEMGWRVDDSGRFYRLLRTSETGTTFHETPSLMVRLSDSEVDDKMRDARVRAQQRSDAAAATARQAAARAAGQQAVEEAQQEADDAQASEDSAAQSEAVVGAIGAMASGQVSPLGALSDSLNQAARANDMRVACANDGTEEADVVAQRCEEQHQAEAIHGQMEGLGAAGRQISPNATNPNPGASGVVQSGHAPDYAPLNCTTVTGRSNSSSETGSHWTDKVVRNVCGFKITVYYCSEQACEPVSELQYKKSDTFEPNEEKTLNIYSGPYACRETGGFIFATHLCGGYP